MQGGPFGIASSGLRLTLPISCPVQPITHRFGDTRIPQRPPTIPHLNLPPKATLLQPGYGLFRGNAGSITVTVTEHLNHMASRKASTEIRVEELKEGLTEGGSIRRREYGVDAGPGGAGLWVIQCGTDYELSLYCRRVRGWRNGNMSQWVTNDSNNKSMSGPGTPSSDGPSCLRRCRDEIGW